MLFHTVMRFRTNMSQSPQNRAIKGGNVIFLVIAVQNKVPLSSVELYG